MKSERVAVKGLKKPVISLRVPDRTQPKPEVAPPPEKPRKPKGFDYRDDPKDMDPEFLVKLTAELIGRVAIHLNIDKKVFDRAQELKAEITRRLKLVPKPA